MKLMEVTEKQIGEYTFFIRPFPAFVSANLSGELAALLMPVLGSLAPLAGNVGDDFDVNDVDLEKLGPAIVDAFSGLSGDKIETLMRKLLISQTNISVSGPATDGMTKILDMDLANEIFCGEFQDMYILCYEVAKINFGGFFKKIGARFGNLPGALQKLRNTADSETSTKQDSQNLN